MNERTSEKDEERKNEQRLGVLTSCGRVKSTCSSHKHPVLLFLVGRIDPLIALSIPWHLARTLCHIVPVVGACA